MESASTTHAIDRAVLQGIRDICSDNNDFRELVEIYLQDLDAKLTLLESAVIKPDFDTVASIAHSMKSSSMSLGAMKLGDIFAQLNTAAKENRHEQMTALFVNLASMQQGVASELQAAADSDVLL
tara:strand:+ start:308635 stop:309009 length:375 start_codon:yes stop_codon:yes gene_type:complete